MHPFTDGDTFATFGNLRRSLVAEIKALDNEYSLKASPTELERHYLDKATVTPLTVDAEGYYIDQQKGSELDVTRDFRRASFGGRIVVKATTLDVAIPYTGDKTLWSIRPTSYSLSGYPEIEIRDDVVVFSVTFPDDSPNPEQLKSDIARSVESLAKTARNLANDVEQHNREAATMIKAAIEQKRKQAEGALGAVAKLGIRIKQRPEPTTYTVPTRRRESPVNRSARPVVATEKYQPEPTLDEKEFDHILGVLKSMSLVIERNPGSFSTLDEEAIRTHFILQLNGHYEGAATGETFNAAGKTDILIRVENRTIFIAECKFWRGQKSFGEAVDQLLSYLSWRDSKCALLIFNQTKDSTATRVKMHETMLSRPEYRKTVSYDPSTDARYVFVKNDDPGREIHICTMLFDIPPEAAK
jgi:hypothetical protein